MTDSLWCFLKPFGFDSDMNHALVGKVKDLLINTFVKQQYIILQNKSSGSSVDQSYCKWGPRADLEFSRLQIVNLYVTIVIDFEVFFHCFSFAGALKYSALRPRASENASTMR